MLLTVLVGNSSTRLAWFDGRKALAARVVSTPAFRRDPARRLPLAPRPDAAALCSVVPAATRPARAAIAARFKLRPFLLTTAAITGLEFDYDRRQLGPDRVCVAAGARERFPGDVIVIDFGTAVTVNALSAEGRFLGGPILPGPGLMLASLHAGTGRLPLVRPAETAVSIPTGTTSALRSGVFAAVVGGVKHAVATVESATGRRFTVLATGGAADRFRKHLPVISACDPLLGARGLAAIWRLNRSR
ncbi:type III pantothenate kinase [candidate division WOR-3 bacterium]|nr:type III pantothenate kinase [candidate division WOR-3 bacterium]